MWRPYPIQKIFTSIQILGDIRRHSTFPMNQILGLDLPSDVYAAFVLFMPNAGKPFRTMLLCP